MAEVRIQEGESLENALRRFKRKVQQEDIIKEVKRHSFYLKPGEKKRVKEALARKRSRKKARKEQDCVLLGHSFPEWPIPFDPRFPGQPDGYPTRPDPKHLGRVRQFTRPDLTR